MQGSKQSGAKPTRPLRRLYAAPLQDRRLRCANQLRAVEDRRKDLRLEAERMQALDAELEEVRWSDTGLPSPVYHLVMQRQRHILCWTE